MNAVPEFPEFYRAANRAMNEHQAAALAAARLGIHPIPHQSELITAAVAFRAAETRGIDVDSDQWLALLDRLRDVADMYLAHLTPALVENLEFLTTWDAAVEDRADEFETFDIPGRAK